VAQHGTTLPVHPTQLYESIGQFVLFVSLLFLRRYRRFRGQITGMWLMCYAVLRSTVELFRGDVERGTLHGLLTSIGGLPLADKVPLEAWYNISTSQFISICMFTGGAIILYRGGKQVFFPAGMTAAAASA
jgi:phosphatidylglycerol:prolipoprotein diacylglycerol transferase